ncbi:MAG: diguanylate cyclase [Sphaerochaetaceae bacterium]
MVIILVMIAINIKKISSPLVKAFLMMMGCALIWNVFYVFELGTNDLAYKIHFARIQYFGLTIIPIAWLLMAEKIAKVHIKRMVWVVLSAIAGALLIVIWILPLPNLFWGNPVVSEVHQNLSVLDYDYGILFYAGYVPFVYLTIAYSLILIARRFRFSISVYRKQGLIIIVGAILPLVVNTLYVLDITPIPHLNLTTASLSITGLLYAWALIQYRFLAPLPIARDVIVEHMEAAVFVFDKDSRLVDYNNSAALLVGNIEQYLGLVAEKFPIGQIGKLVSTDFSGDKEVPGQIEIDQTIFDISVRHICLTGKRVEATVVTLYDVTEKEDLYRQVRELALRDPLTGLYNRRALMEMGVDLIKGINGDSSKHFCAMMFDIDRFKLVNDTYGHAAGDRSLVAIAKTFIHHTRAHDLIGRLGGDEFIVLMPDTTLEEALGIANTIHEEVGRIVLFAPKKTFSVTLSIGVASNQGLLISDPQESLEKLISLADRALYQAKENGKNCVSSMC